MDSIHIDNLKIFANHGVFDYEKKNGQNFYVDAVLYLDTQKAGITDDLMQSVSYAEVCDVISESVTVKSYDLIERVAETVAIKILDGFELVRKVAVTVKKPEAPIDMTFENVSVHIERMRHKAYIAYGSNLGDSESIIKGGLDTLAADKYVKLIADSGIVRSSAYGVTDQPDFLNGVVEIETYYEPALLLERLHEIEKAAGRERKLHWGPRTLDLDIVLYDHLVLDSRELTIPHSDMCKRDFVLVPLGKLAGWYRHPVYNKTINELISELKEIHIKE